MQLEPFYEQPPPDRTHPPKEYKFRIVGYSRYQDYVLTTWRVENGDGLNPRSPNARGYVDGQTLWRVKTHLHSQAEKILLYSGERLPQPGVMPIIGHPIKDVLHPSLGRFGLPPAAAIALQDPANYIVIEP